MARYSGLITPVVTPLTADRDVDHDALRSVIDFQISAGADGVFVLGSSGEAVYLGDADRAGVLRTAVEHVAGRVPLLAGALAPSPRRVVDQVRWIESFPVDAVVVTAPFYANVSDGEIVRHFELVARATGLPVLAYDIPGNVGRKIPVPVFRALLRSKTIAGLKDSSGGIEDLRLLLESTDERAGASLLTGADVLADQALSLGADGLIAGLANVRPDLFVEIVTAHRLGDPERARRAQARIDVLARISPIGARHGLGRHASELGAMKQAMADAGVIPAPRVCDPLEQYPAAALAELRAVLADVDGAAA